MDHIAEEAKPASEIWRDISGWPYQVSDLGRVRSLRRILRARPGTNGYLRVNLCKEGIVKDFYIHRLVCEAFNGTCPEGHECDHADKNRANNVLHNLSWRSKAENLYHRSHPRGRDHCNAKLSEDQVKEIIGSGFIRGRDRFLAEKFSVSREAVRDVRLGRAWGHLR